MVKLLQKLLLIILTVSAVAVWGWWVYLDSYYYENAPRTPVIAEGRIHPRIVHHGSQVFLTDKEKFNLNVLYPSLPLLCILIAGVLDKHWKHFYFARDSRRAKQAGNSGMGARGNRGKGEGVKKKSRSV